MKTLNELIGEFGHNFEHYDDFNGDAASLNLSVHVYKRLGTLTDHLDWIESEIKRIKKEK